jgi:hypothetical protein
MRTSGSATSRTATAPYARNAASEAARAADRPRRPAGGDGAGTLGCGGETIPGT